MKKYLFGLVAAVLSLAAVAFTSPDVIGVKQATYEFYYTAPGGSYSDANVKTNGNWNISSIACNATNNGACNMRVQAAYTKLVGSNRVLRTSADGAPFLNIQTLASGTDYYVTTTTGVNNIVNRSL